MEDQDESDLGRISMEVLDRRLRQQANTEEEEDDPFGNDDSFSGSESSTVQEHVPFEGNPRQLPLEDTGDIKMDLSDDEDTVNELKVDDNSLSSFAKRVQAASAQQHAVDNDEVSTADPFENLTDSDAPVAHQLKKGEIDISSAIHSQAERGEFNIDTLVEQFRAAQRAHEEVFGNVLSLPRVQGVLAPQAKIEIPKQVQIDFLKQCDSPINSASKANLLDSYKTMLLTCVEQHLQSITNANRRRSFGTKRRLYSRVDDLDLSDAQAYIHSFLSALMLSYFELIAKSESGDARQWIESRIKSVEECIAEMVVQIQAEISLDRASRVDNIANLEGAIFGRLAQLEERLAEIKSPDSIRCSEKHRRQLSSDPTGSPENRRTHSEAVIVQSCDKKNGCDCSRWLTLLLQLCTVFLLFEIFHFSVSPIPRTREPFLS